MRKLLSKSINKNKSEFRMQSIFKVSVKTSFLKLRLNNRLSYNKCVDSFSR